MLEADLECRWSRVQSRTVSYQRQYKNGTSISLVYHSNLKKGKTGSFSRIKIGQNLMDKIWDRSPSKSEVIGCCGWGRKIKWPCRTDKSNAKKEGDQTVDSPSDVYYEYRCHSISFMEWLTSLGQGADILCAAWS